MKFKYALPTILSLSTLSATPMTLCSCSNDVVQNHGNIVNDETFTITFNSTVGHGHTVYDEEGQEIEIGSSITVDASKDFKCTFASTEYGEEEAPKMPVHRQLKVKDVEVVQGNKNIIGKCSLINNVLIIPSTLLQDPNKPIEINLLGAEIADWITWDDIQKMSKDDDEHEDPKYSVTNWFEVGDYKMLYEDKKAQSYGYATIIDMEKTDYIYKEGNREKTAPAPFTFEIFEPHDNIEWSTDAPNQNAVNPWEVDGNDKIWEKGYKYGEDKKFGFTPRMVDLNSTDKKNNHSYFYILSVEEQLGINKAGFDDTLPTWHFPIEDKTSVNAFYAYYNKSKYHSIKTLCQRVNRGKLRFTRNIGPTNGANPRATYIIGNDNTYAYMRYGFEIKRPVSWVFCL